MREFRVDPVEFWAGRIRESSTFHKYAGDLWSIRAGRFGICGSCRKPISVGQEITLFEGVSGWAHMVHATDQPSLEKRLEKAQRSVTAQNRLIPTEPTPTALHDSSSCIS